MSQTVHVIDLVKEYTECGFSPFPLKEMTKYPLTGIPLDDAPTWGFSSRSNIGLFAGSKNGFVVLDADSEQTKKAVLSKFFSMGLLSWLTIVHTPKRNGLHFWLKVFDVPDTAQAYYKLEQEHIGSGELRLKKPSYVLAPGSKIPEGEYEFSQGSCRYFFDSQPALSWSDIAWVLPTYKQAVAVRADAPINRRYNPRPKVLRLMEILQVADSDDRIPFINFGTGELAADKYYGSRSEAEYALVLGLILAGWSFEQIEDIFEEHSPTHYAGRASPEGYLEATYKNAARNVTDRGRRPN